MSYKNFLIAHFTIYQESSLTLKLEEQLSQTSEHVHLGLIYAWLEEDFGHDFRYLHIPILVLAGARDTLFPSSIYGVTANYMKAEFMMIPAAAHLVSFDNPDATADAVLEFMAAIETGRHAGKGFSLNREGVADSLYRGFEQVEETNNILFVRLLHTFSVQIGNIELTKGWNLRKVKSLFLFLLFHGTATRDEILEAFWSELPLNRARNQLRMNLHFLKSILNQDRHEFLHADREHVFLNHNLHCDAIPYVNQLKEAYVNMLRGELDLPTARSILEISPKKLVAHVYDEWYLHFGNEIQTQYIELCQWTSDRLNALQRNDDAEKYQLRINYLLGIDLEHPQSADEKKIRSI